MSRSFQKLLRVGGGRLRKKEKDWQRLYLRLPSDWAEKMRLRSGDWVMVVVDEEGEGTLKISVTGGGEDDNPLPPE